VPHALKVALANLGKLTVGLSERYQESVCLFASKISPERELPEFCNCADRVAWRSFRSINITYKYPRHSLSDLSAAELKLVDELTRDDVQLYQAAKGRFEAEVRELEQERRVKILC